MILFASELRHTRCKWIVVDALLAMYAHIENSYVRGTASLYPYTFGDQGNMLFAFLIPWTLGSSLAIELPP